MINTPQIGQLEKDQNPLLETLQIIVNMIDAPHFNAARKYKIRELAAKAIKDFKEKV
jgi:hypothetical protein